MAETFSEYELLRLRNIKRNHEFMKSLGKLKCFMYSDVRPYLLFVFHSSKNNNYTKLDLSLLLPTPFLLENVRVLAAFV